MGKLRKGLLYLATLVAGGQIMPNADDITISPMPPSQGDQCTIGTVGPYPRTVTVKPNPGSEFTIEVTGPSGTAITVGAWTSFKVTSPGLAGNGTAVNP